MELDSYASAWYEYDRWPFDLISTSQTQVHTWPNCDEITSNSYKDIVLNRFFGSLSAVTLLFDLLTPKANRHIYEPKYICDQNWVKFASLFLDTVFTRFRVIACCDLDLLTLKSNQHIYEPIGLYNCDQNWVKFPFLVFEIRCSQDFRFIDCYNLDLWPFDSKI